MLMLGLWVAFCLCRNGQKLVCCSATNALLATVSSQSNTFQTYNCLRRERSCVAKA